MQDSAVRERRMRLRNATPVLAFLATFAVFIFLEKHATTFLGSDQVEREWPIWLYPLVFAVMTFLGVFARSIYEVLNSPRAPKTYGEILREAAAPNRLLLSLIVSPIVMALFYKTIRGADDLMFVVVSSFQNGFFWRSVLKRR
jgi:membrane protease YdiL (CAAX protease family)